MRGAEKDMALCDRATPGPWGHDPKEGCIEDSAGDRLCQFWDKREEDFKNAKANGDLIAAAREALPYWIKRAMGLEKALHRACVKIEDLTGDCPGSLCWLGCGGTDGECSSDQVGCWKKYFLEEVDHDTP